MLQDWDKHLERVVSRAILDARSGGHDYKQQNELAARFVRRMKPEWTVSEAMTVVEAVQQRQMEAARPSPT
jgi:hypothetical protein